VLGRSSFSRPPPPHSNAVKRLFAIISCGRRKVLKGSKAYQHSTKRLLSDPNPPARLLRARSSSSSAARWPGVAVEGMMSSHLRIVPRRSVNEMSFLNSPSKLEEHYSGGTGQSVFVDERKKRSLTKRSQPACPSVEGKELLLGGALGSVEGMCSHKRESGG
jgi:hypothetical protein